MSTSCKRNTETKDRQKLGGLLFLNLVHLSTVLQCIQAGTKGPLSLPLLSSSISRNLPATSPTHRLPHICCVTVPLTLTSRHASFSCHRGCILTHRRSRNVLSHKTVHMLEKQGFGACLDTQDTATDPRIIATTVMIYNVTVPAADCQRFRYSCRGRKNRPGSNHQIYDSQDLTARKRGKKTDRG